MVLYDCLIDRINNLEITKYSIRKGYGVIEELAKRYEALLLKITRLRRGAQYLKGRKALGSWSYSKWCSDLSGMFQLLLCRRSSIGRATDLLAKFIYD